MGRLRSASLLRSMAGPATTTSSTRPPRPEHLRRGLALPPRSDLLADVGRPDRVPGQGHTVGFDPELRDVDLRFESHVQETFRALHRSCDLSSSIPMNMD